jgi:hypothetical protein
MSCTCFPKTILKKMDRTKKRFFWWGEEKKGNTI